MPSLAVTLIGPAILAWARPLASNAPILVQRSSFAPLVSSASICELSHFAIFSTLNALNLDADPSYIPIIIHTSPPKIEYNTPLEFMNSFLALQTTVRRRQIDLWKSSRVKGLEAKVDSLEASGLPSWLVYECWGQVMLEGRRIRDFLDEEAGNPSLRMTIEQHKEDVARVREKLLKYKPWPEFQPPPSDVDEGDLCANPESPIHNVHDDLWSKFSPASLLKIPDRVVNSRDKELQTKARRKRITQWKEGQAKTLMDGVESLPASGFPAWLVDDFYNEISMTRGLIEVFKREETDHVHLEEMQNHEAELGKVEQALTDACNKEVGTHLKHLGPKIRPDGSWRNQIISITDAVVKSSQSNNERERLNFELNAGFQTYREMVTLGPKDHQEAELRRFRRFLCKEQERVTKRKGCKDDSTCSSNFLE
ncbi:hypothetical protein H0H93_010291 [Arthromyces matolae]|nr:hypothetical protein H0H93_010291 [Arthromyces matolae]